MTPQTKTIIYIAQTMGNKGAPSEKLLDQTDSNFDKKTNSLKFSRPNQIHTSKMKASLISQLKCPSKLVHYPLWITCNFASFETSTGRSSDHILKHQLDDGMTKRARALGIPLCALSERSLQSLLSGRRYITLQ